MENLGRDEEALDSYDKTREIGDNYPETRINRDILFYGISAVLEP